MTGAMKMRALLLVSLAACGGTSTSSTPTTTTPPPPAAGMTAPDLWAPVMKQGAVFTFVDRLPEGPSSEEFHTVEATVTNVADVPDGKVAMITWTLDGAPLETSNLPGAIVVTAAEVRFQADTESDPNGAVWPATTADLDQDHNSYALAINAGNLSGERCYGMGPGIDSEEECEDVCEFSICVHPKHGLTGGHGTWWPDMGAYYRRDLAK
jgi:hypothetical protein